MKLLDHHHGIQNNDYLLSLHEKRSFNSMKLHRIRTAYSSDTDCVLPYKAIRSPYRENTGSVFGGVSCCGSNVQFLHRIRLFVTIDTRLTVSFCQYILYCYIYPWSNIL